MFKSWTKYEVDWCDLYNDKGLEHPDVIGDLMGLHIGILYKKLERDDNKHFGLLPIMASCSLGQLGALNAESYAERVNSVGKQVLTEGNTLLSDEEVDMLVLL